MKASIIMPAYNVEKYVGIALDSVRHQKGFPLNNLEVIVVDDKSTDTTLRTVKNYSGNHPELKMQILEHNQRRGAGAARNTAFSKAQGNLLVMFDADDILHLNCIRKCVRVYEKSLEIGLVYSDHAQVKATTGLIPTAEEVTHTERQPPFDLNRYLNNEIASIGHVKSVRRSVNIPFDETLSSAEDTKWWLSMFIKGIKFYHIPKVLYFWRRGVLSLCSIGLTQTERDQNHKKAVADALHLLS